MGFLLNGDEVAGKPVGGVQGHVHRAPQSVGRHGRKEQEALILSQQHLQLLLHLRTHPKTVQSLEPDLLLLELQNHPLARLGPLAGKGPRKLRPLVLRRELARLPALAILPVQPTENLQRLQQGVPGLSFQGLPTVPYAVDQITHAHPLLGIVEHDRVGPAGQPVGDHHPGVPESGRLSGGQQVGPVVPLGGRAPGVQDHRGPGLVRILGLRFHLDPRARKLRGHPVADMVPRQHPLVGPDVLVAVHHVRHKRRRVGDQQKGKADQEKGNQPDQHKGTQKRAEYDRVPSQVIELHRQTVAADPVRGPHPQKEQKPAEQDLDPAQIEPRPAPALLKRVARIRAVLGNERLGTRDPDDDHESQNQ